MGKFSPRVCLRPPQGAGAEESSRSGIPLDNPQGLDVRLFANPDVPFERDAFEQLFDFLDVARAASDVRDAEKHGAPAFFGDAPAGIDRVVLTPDFHKGSLVPVGTVARARHMCIPQAIGNDVCCGMRLLVTDLPAEALEPHWPAIQKRLRAIFFAGERDIPMSPRQREAVRAHARGSFATRRLFGFERFIQSSGQIDGRDPQIGCVGGGNHFVELQRIDARFDGHAARAWGLSKGSLAIMIHSGSVGLGHAVGGHFMDRARVIFPAGVQPPKGGFYPLPTSGPRAEEGLFYLDGMGNAANFAFANRLFLGLMAVRAIEEASGRSVSSRLVYDAPHNLVFRDEEVCPHRKGAAPAHGPSGGDWLGKPSSSPAPWAPRATCSRARATKVRSRALATAQAVRSRAGAPHTSRVTCSCARRRAFAWSVPSIRAPLPWHGGATSSRSTSGASWRRRPTRTRRWSRWSTPSRTRASLARWLGSSRSAR